METTEAAISCKGMLSQLAKQPAWKLNSLSVVLKSKLSSAH